VQVEKVEHRILVLVLVLLGGTHVLSSCHLLLPEGLAHSQVLEAHQTLTQGVGVPAS
jgi:hypothetical protein